MRSTFAGINMALRALLAQQTGVDVTNHNIGNANTVGYSRQEAELGASAPYAPVGPNTLRIAGQIGTGVQAEAIRRFRSAFTDLQFRHETQSLGYWDLRQDVLHQVELLFAEPSEAGLSASLSRFWNSWRELANAPESAAARQNVVQTTVTLTDQIRDLDRRLNDVRTDLDQQVAQKVIDVNNLATRLAALNDEIVSVIASGNQPNDLRDERDRLLDDLSQIVSFSYRESQEGALQVMVGGRPLVLGNRAYPVAAIADPNNGGLRTVRWAEHVDLTDDSSRVVFSDGELQALVETRDTALTTTIDQLDQLAQGFIAEVNQLHMTGLGQNEEPPAAGRLFFADAAGNASTGVSDIQLNPAIRSDLSLIAAASTTEPPDSQGGPRPGDSANALAIADLQGKLVPSINGVSFEKFYSGIITQLGVDVKQAEVMSKNQGVLIDHLKERRESVSGISLDEEASNLIRFQRAYEAAARLMNATDEMLDRIINGMGLVGR